MGLTTRDLVREAAGWGFEITSRQLERWRNADILPKMRRHGQGKGQGARWLYPPDAVEGLRLFLTIRKADEPLAETAVRMWLRSAETPSLTVRKHIQAALIVHRKLRRTFQRKNPREFGESLADNASRNPSARGPFGAGKFDETVADQIRDMGEALGTAFVDPATPISPDGSAAIEVALEVTPSERAAVKMLGADLSATIPEGLARMVTGDTAIEAASDADLMEAREMCKTAEYAVSLAAQLPHIHPIRSLFFRIGSLSDSAAALLANLQAIRWARDTGADPQAQMHVVIQALRGVVAQVQNSAKEQSRSTDAASAPIHE